MLGFEIFDQIFQTTNLALQAIKYFKYDSGFDLFDLRAALVPCLLDSEIDASR